jgi:hypothetical protein
VTKSLGGSDGKKKRAFAAHADPSFFLLSNHPSWASCPRERLDRMRRDARRARELFDRVPIVTVAMTSAAAGNSGM